MRISSREKLFNAFSVFFVISLILTASVSSAATPSLDGCPLFPYDNVWNTPVDNLPLDPNSSAYISTIGPATGLHPDFGSGQWDGGPIGIPYTLVSGSQPKVSVTFEYAGESDQGPYPVPADAAIEGGSQSTGDRHVLVLDKDNCILYELYSAYPQPNGSWKAGSGAVFQLGSNALRPLTWTSADAAGLPILPGLVRYDEVASGEISHALRFTAPSTRNKFIWPARHYASDLTAVKYPPMGQRFRLKSDYNIAGFSPQVQVILQALKKYGMILADNGSSWYISGAPDPRWKNDSLHELSGVPGSAFEALDESSLMITSDSGKAVQTVSSLTAKAISQTKIILTWKDNSGFEAGFKVERKPGSCSDNGSWVQIALKGENAISHTDTALSPNSTFSYRVRAYSAGGNSAYSNCASTKTGMPGTPNSPTSLEAVSASAGMINLSWKDNSSDESVFKIYRKDGPSVWSLLHTVASGVFNHADSSAAGNSATTSYSYYVKACNSSGCSPSTNTAIVPFKPTHLAAASAAGKITLSWDDTSRNESGFEVYRKSGSCSLSAETWSLLATRRPNIRSFADNSLSPGTQYSYKVRAYYSSFPQPRAYGYSLFSNCIGATTP